MPRVALWLGIFAIYAASLAVDAVDGSRFSAAEAHHLLVAESIVTDADFDLRDEYRTKAWRDFYDGQLRPRGKPQSDGRIHEPQGAGFGLFIAPAYAIGGATAVELWLAALAALGFVAAAALARRLVPEPWATRGVVIGALSLPAVAYATTVLPELAAGALIAIATALALRIRDDERTGHDTRALDAIAAAILLAIVLWFGPKFALVGVPVLVVMVRWTRRAGRRFVGLVAAEVAFASLVAYLTTSDILFGGWTPYATDASPLGPTGAEGLIDHAARAGRLITLWVDPDQGLLRWAPFLALAFVGAYLLLRSRSERLAAVLQDQARSERAATLMLTVVAAALLVATFAAASIDGPWPPGRHLIVVLPLLAALAAWGMRRLPRTGTALAAATLALTILQVSTGAVS